MGQVAGQLAEGGELFGLLLDACDLADAVNEGGNHALGHGGNGLEHLGEQRLVNEQRRDRGDGKSLAAGGLHARKGQQAGDLTGASDEQGHGTAMLTADVNFALEDEDHVLGGRAFLEENVAGVGCVFLAMCSEPEAILDGQSVQGPDAIEGGRDFFNGSGTGRGGNGGGKHPETSRAQIQDSRW